MEIDVKEEICTDWYNGTTFDTKFVFLLPQDFILQHCKQTTKIIT